MQQLLIRVRHCLFAGALILSTTVCAAEPSDEAITVVIKDFVFAPAFLKIRAGQTVTWINSDEEPHAVSANNKAYRSPTLDTGERFSKTFATTGEFSYFCTLHPHMLGKIVVEDAVP